MARRVIVVGGGLAGMTVSLELARRGVTVELVEAGDRLGGKAGADVVGGRREDHGFHLFPGWYANTRALLAEIGASSRLIDLHSFLQVRRGEWPKTIEIHEPATIGAFLANLFSGALPWRDNLLAIYSLLDLAAEPDRKRPYLDRVSGTGFLRSRFYASERMASFHHQAVLQASSIPFHDLSAMTVRRLVRVWMQTPSPFMSVLDGDLQSRFIAPFQARLEQLGVVVLVNRPVADLVVDGGRVGSLAMRDGTRIDAGDADVVLAVPHREALEIASRAVLHHEMSAPVNDATDRELHFELRDLANLRSAPMAALHLHLRRRIPTLPREHVILLGSRFSSSFIDVGVHWGLDHSAIQLIASDFEALRHLDDAQVKELIVGELVEYVTDIRPDDLPDDGGFLQRHADAPLFLNTVAAWDYRPGATTSIPNLFLAGDYCRSQADLTTMESAVMSAITTAGAILERAGIERGLAPRPLAEPPDLLLQLVRYGALPVVAPLALLGYLEDALIRPRR